MKLIHELVTIRISMVHTDAVAQEALMNTIHARTTKAIDDIVQQYVGKLMRDPVTVRIENPAETTS